MTERKRKKRRSKRSRRRKRTIWRRALRLVFWLAAGYALVTVLRLPIFVVREVEVTGTDIMSEVEVKRVGRLDRRLYAWQVWPWSVERLLLRHPRIGTAEVALSGINRVRVVIEEREPVAYVAGRADGFLEVDGEGRVLSHQPGLTGEGEPLITGIPEASYRPGERITLPPALRAVALAAELGSDGRVLVSEIHVGDNGEIVLYTMGGIPVFLGMEEDWSLKVQVLKGILTQTGGGAGLAYVDLRSARRPVVKPR